MQETVLLLEDGFCLRGRSMGAPNCYRIGEVVFSTAMTGYTEMLSDPSYVDQILILTHPHVGNYGVSEEDFESDQFQIAGLVTREISERISHYRVAQPLAQSLKSFAVPALSGVDTRALVLHMRNAGTMRGIISSEEGISIQTLHERLQKSVSEPLIYKASTSYSYCYVETSKSKSSFVMPVKTGIRKINDIPALDVFRLNSSDIDANANDRNDSDFRQNDNLLDSRFHGNDKKQSGNDRMKKIVVIDFGVKQNILRMFTELGCQLTVVPPSYTAEAIFSLNPDAVVLSSGPGDPKDAVEAIETVRVLIGKIPLFGICMGFQVLARALGAETYKLNFGHRGANHGVEHEGKAIIVSQNHGYAVDERGLKSDTLRLYRNLSDGTLEGFECVEQKIFAVQYHPEASPGPWDAHYLFEQFLNKLAAKHP